MSRNKRGSGADALYAQHLGGYGFRENPAHQREVAIERMYYRVLMELAANRFKWEGLPPEIDVRYMELTLFQQGLCLFFKDDQYDKFFAMKAGSLGRMNMLNNPTTFRAIGNGYSKSFRAAPEYNMPGNGLSVPGDPIAIPIWANYARMPDVDIVSIYAKRLANFDRTIEINSANARQTRVVAHNDNQTLSMENINRQIDGGEQAIKVAGPLQDMAFLTAIDLGINPDTIEKLDIVRARQWNVAMGLLGIENANQDKKERLVASEVDANDGQVTSMKYVNLNARQRAADQINEIFGLNVTVDYNTKVDDSMPAAPELMTWEP